jgi:hypothetical protein
MKARFGMALTMAVGAALGGAAIQAPHAQAKPPVYMIAINDVSDQEHYAKEYVSPARKRSRITVGSMSLQGQEHRLRETCLMGRR